VQFGAGASSCAATVVDFVTVKTSRFQQLSTLEDFLQLNLKEFHEERRVEHLVPNQMPKAIEIC
jgi:hypothetical protein